MVKPPKIRFHTHFNKKSLSIKPLFCDFVDKLKRARGAFQTVYKTGRILKIRPVFVHFILLFRSEGWRLGPFQVQFASFF
ncbi:hypothetical protein Q1M14_12465, partial [Staphylococcus haemolyticus]|nr:hypothetical protein [Staphylococcus haemolyticus]